MGISDSRIATVCPPVIEYSRAFQARGSLELTLLRDESAVVTMMQDYAVMREQARSCADA